MTTVSTRVTCSHILVCVCVEQMTINDITYSPNSGGSACSGSDSGWLVCMIMAAGVFGLIYWPIKDADAISNGWYWILMLFIVGFGIAFICVGIYEGHFKRCWTDCRQCCCARAEVAILPQ